MNYYKVHSMKFRSYTVKYKMQMQSFRNCWKHFESIIFCDI